MGALCISGMVGCISVVRSFSHAGHLFNPSGPFNVVHCCSFPCAVRRGVGSTLSMCISEPLNIFISGLRDGLAGVGRGFLRVESVFRTRGVRGFAGLPRTERSEGVFTGSFDRVARLLRTTGLRKFA